MSTKQTKAAAATKTTSKKTTKGKAPKAASVRAQSPQDAPKATKASKPTTERRASRKDAIVALISRPKGATLPEIMEATGWQAHSVRGMISTLGKKGLTITSQKTDAGERVYTTEANGAPTAKAKAKTPKAAKKAAKPVKATPEVDGKTLAAGDQA